MSAGEFKPSELPALVLAYLGDVVWESFVRRKLLMEMGIGSTANKLHKGALKLVSADAQASVIEELLPLLSEEEASVLKRGRRARARRANHPSSMAEYRNSTGFEALLGYLDLSGREGRLAEVMEQAYRIAKERCADACS